MGEEIPIDPPELIDAKWYHVTCKAYTIGCGGIGCDGCSVGNVDCCRTGAVIKGWIDLGSECFNFVGLCAAPAHLAEKLVNIVGPFDTQVLCQADI